MKATRASVDQQFLRGFINLIVKPVDAIQWHVLRAVHDYRINGRCFNPLGDECLLPREQGYADL
jgi:hypothetical protein